MNMKKVEKAKLSLCFEFTLFSDKTRKLGIFINFFTPVNLKFMGTLYVSFFLYTTKWANETEFRKMKVGQIYIYIYKFLCFRIPIFFVTF